MMLPANQPLDSAWLDAFSFFQVASTIPYKQSATPIEQHGGNELIVLVVFTLIAIAVLLYLRKKDVKELNLTKHKKVKIVERTRVSGHTSIVLIQYKNRFFLLGQTPENISLITEVDVEDA